MDSESYDTLSGVLNRLKAKGYVEDFNLNHNCIECKAQNLQLFPANFIIDSYYRFEGASNPDDNSIVYAISSKDGLKGTLVDAYGVYSSNLNEEMIEKLRVAKPSPSDSI
jgi:hypothetical protein